VHHRTLLAQQLHVASETGQNTEEQPLTARQEMQGDVQEQTVQEETGDVAVKDSRTENRQIERRRPSSKDKLQLPVGNTKKEKSRGWSVGLAVGNTGGLISGNNISEGSFIQSDADFGYSGGKVDLSTVANGILAVPEGQELVFKNGMPYLLKNKDQIVDVDHKQPLSFGFSVRKGLAKGFSVETGLTYTYLASDVKFAGSSENSAKTTLSGHSSAGKLELCG
jgi:hypothetical protein